MKTRILYAGDTHLHGAAAYLAGVLTHAGLPFDYVSSDAPLRPSLEKAEPRLYIISDYPVKNLTDADFQRIVGDVERGGGLLMIGGWESYVGLGGDYHKTVLAEMLPLRMGESDDRVNSFSPCVIRAESEHPIVKELPFNSTPAAINGYNRLQLHQDAELILSLIRYSASWEGTNCTFKEQSVDPLLAVCSVGAGRVASYAGDVAPHWAGGFVDWGDRRHTLQAKDAGEVEVGNWYMQFFGNIINWLVQDI
jgi:hypothetical protein